MTVGSFPFLYATLELPKIIINDALAESGRRTILSLTLSQVHYLFALCGLFLLTGADQRRLQIRHQRLRGHRLGEGLLRLLRSEL